MFKSKIKVWGILIFVVFILYLVPTIFQWITNITHKEYLNLSLYLDENNNQFTYILNKTKLKNNIQLIVSNKENSDIRIISEFDKDTVNNLKENYENYENYFYSPLVLLSKQQPCEESEIFANDNPIGNEIYSVNLKYILQAIEMDKTWGDIGLKNDKFFKSEKKIELVFPDKNQFFYNKCVNLIILTLNDFKKPTQIEYNELYHRAITIINKSPSYKNFNILKENVISRIYLVPEYIRSTYYDGYIIHPKTTLAIYNDLYLKKDSEYKDLIKDILMNDKNFTKYFCFRNIEMNYNINDVAPFSHSNNFLTIKNDSDILDTNILDTDIEDSNVKDTNILDTNLEDIDILNTNLEDINIEDSFVNILLYFLFFVLLLLSFLILSSLQ